MAAVRSLSGLFKRGRFEPAQRRTNVRPRGVQYREPLLLNRIVGSVVRGLHFGAICPGIGTGHALAISAL